MANGGIRRIEGARLAVMAVKRGGKGRRIAGHAHRGSRRGHRPPGHAHRHRARMKWVERRLGVVGNEVIEIIDGETISKRLVAFRVRNTVEFVIRRGTGKVVSWCKRGDQCMFLRLRRRLDGRDKMGRTRGMFLRLINGKVEMLRACFKLDIYIYIHIWGFARTWRSKTFFSFSWEHLSRRIAILFVKS